LLLAITNVPNTPQPDFILDEYIVPGGRTVEGKTISNVTDTSPDHLSQGVADTIESAGRQAPHVFIDTRQQTGFTKAVAERAIRRAWVSTTLGRSASTEQRVIGYDVDGTFFDIRDVRRA